MCKKEDHNDVIEINTWSGDFVNEKPTPICKIDEQSKVRHYVRVAVLKNKPRATKVLVRGIVEGDRAKFEGDPTVIKSDREWACLMELRGTYGMHERLIDVAAISKKSRGNEIVRVEVEYEGPWDFLRPAGSGGHALRRANLDKLVFKIDVV
jgi:hypothetical protein